MASGPARASSSRANNYADDRFRNSVPNGGFRSEAASYADGAQQPGMAHKRSASGNPRPVNRTTTTTSTDEKRYDERRITERTFEAHVDRMLKRTASPEKQSRRSGASDRKDSELRRQKSVEFRPKESVSETAQGTLTLF